MTKSIKKTGGSGFMGIERAVVFCLSRREGAQIKEQLAKKNMAVWLVQDEKRLWAQLEESDPDMILLEINAATSRPIEQIVADVFRWTRERSRKINKALNSPTQYLWQKAKVFLFKTESELTGLSSLSGEAADIDDLVRQCNVFGDAPYLGTYSSLSLIAKIRLHL